MNGAGGSPKDRVALSIIKSVNLSFFFLLKIDMKNQYILKMYWGLA